MISFHLWEYIIDKKAPHFPVVNNKNNKKFCLERIWSFLSANNPFMHFVTSEPICVTPFHRNHWIAKASASFPLKTLITPLVSKNAVGSTIICVWAFISTLFGPSTILDWRFPPRGFVPVLQAGPCHFELPSDPNTPKGRICVGFEGGHCNHLTAFFSTGWFFFKFLDSLVQFPPCTS